jgi:ribosome-associated protein
MHRPDETPLRAVSVAERPSKTRRKAQMVALQDLGAALARVDPGRLRGLDLPERLTEAIADAGRMTQRGARRRQLQLIGRLMREVDPTTIHALETWLGERR